MNKIIIIPKKITRENFSVFGDLISTYNSKSISINSGYAKRFNCSTNIDVSRYNGKILTSIFTAKKRAFPMQIDMMEKHPLGSQTFIPMKETTFLCFVSSPGEKPEINKIKSFVIPPGMGINYKAGIWHFPLISTENMNFFILERKGTGNNLVIHKFKKHKIILKYEK